MSAQLRLSATHMESGRRPMGAAPLFVAGERVSESIFARHTNASPGETYGEQALRTL